MTSRRSLFAPRISIICNNVRLNPIALGTSWWLYFYAFKIWFFRIQNE